VAIEPLGHRDDNLSNGVLVAATAHVLSLGYQAKAGQANHDRNQGGSLHRISSCTVSGSCVLPEDEGY
jgi:hypothetical protein